MSISRSTRRRTVLTGTVALLAALSIPTVGAGAATQGSGVPAWTVSSSSTQATLVSPLATARQLQRDWNTLRAPLRAVSARCRASTNGRHYCHLELRQTRPLASQGKERCLYLEIAPPRTWLRITESVCDDGGGLQVFEPLLRTPTSMSPAS